MVCATFSPVLTGTVLLSTTMRYSLMWTAISRATPSTKLRSTLPSGCGGVGTAMKMTFEAVDGVADGGGEGEPAGGDVLLHQLFQARLVDRDVAVLELVDFLQIVIDADHAVAHFGKAGAGDQSDITRSNNGKIHKGEIVPISAAAGQDICSRLISTSCGVVDVRTWERP